MRPIFARKPFALENVSEDTEYIRAHFNNPGAEAYVAQELDLCDADWNAFTSRMLDEYDWIKDFNDEGYPYENGQTPCIRVTNQNADFALIVDPSGYDYARYVAYDPDHSPRHVAESRTERAEQSAYEKRLAYMNKCAREFISAMEGVCCGRNTDHFPSCVSYGPAGKSRGDSTVRPCQQLMKLVKSIDRCLLCPGMSKSKKP